jgi:oligopeptide transport system permease protein
MISYIVRRLFFLVPVVILVAATTFILMRNTPGSPWDTSAERRQVDASTQKRLDAYYGLDKPMWRQFVAYVFGDFDKDGKFVCGFMCGNMGPSYRQRGRTVQQILFEPPEDKTFWESKFGYSARLGLIALGMAIVVGIPLGVAAALRQNTWVDYVSLFFATAGVSLPNLVLGIFMIIIFAGWLNWVPVAPKEWTDPKVWILPAVVLGFGTLAFTTRLTRTSMLEVLRQDYVRTARAKGLAERVVITRHMIKNALIPVVTILGPALAALVTGSFVIETMYSFPGMGRTFVSAIFQRDYSMIMGTTLFFAVLVALANLSVDVVYVFLDPRIRLSD